MRDYDHFIAALSDVTTDVARISVEGEGGSAQVIVQAPNGRKLPFDGTLDDVYTAVENTDAEGLYPGEDASSIDTKLKLFSVHIYEALETAPDNATLLRLRSFGVKAV
ncbi:hypothetical protein E2F48_04015 [Arthrobacter crusticola]|uniref:Uncharacterized protein n=1 Tax=Arthrobacter crusticola TaxID=2547960 RepID=A0A4R5TYT0_9MICC|nr:hypothetical protein [Arthrobacter crusticola]TDK26375.1 hypothetical protein E2F48_04015 [Arthrobacter crusticola]